MKQIKEFPNYSITKIGKVWNNKHKRWLVSLKKNKNSGYLRINLYKNGKLYRKSIHRLVLEAFIGRCPKGMECCHNNGIKDDNRLENLRWDSRSNNQKDSVKHGTANCIKCGEESSYHKLTERDVRTIIYTWRTNLFTQREIADMYNISNQQISKIVNRKNWKHLWEKRMYTCDDCEKQKEDVKLTTCPYAEDINDEIQECYLCDDCYSERSRDI